MGIDNCWQPGARRVQSLCSNPVQRSPAADTRVRLGLEQYTEPAPGASAARHERESSTYARGPGDEALPVRASEPRLLASATELEHAVARQNSSGVSPRVVIHCRRFGRRLARASAVTEPAASTNRGQGPVPHDAEWSSATPRSLSSAPPLLTTRPATARDTVPSPESRNTRHERSRQQRAPTPRVGAPRAPDDDRAAANAPHFSVTARKNRVLRETGYGSMPRP